ncbi:protein of unknown function [Denitratisoma oestradiolicum]|uniref:Uncharacterized protein n=1 Tax=Denitratisoma oestradiolicum TaxID=311182 RepID=A0A6S6XXC6_9PROT|nr:protein of unknown function [Denitratisoma oestradiolicum]
MRSNSTNVMYLNSIELNVHYFPNSETPLKSSTQESISLDRKAVAYLHETSVRFFKYAAPERHCECRTRPAMEATGRQGFST